MAKMMSGAQVKFLRELVSKKEADPEEWRMILLAYNIEKEDDLYHLNAEQASQLIWRLMKMPNK